MIRRITSGELLKQRNGLFIRKGYGPPLPGLLRQSPSRVNVCAIVISPGRKPVKKTLVGSLIIALYLFAPGAAADDVIRIATFNIQTFGRTKIARPETTDVLVNIVRKYDIVAVQELQDVREEVADQFLAMLGPGWDMSESPRTGRDENDRNSQEQYVFYYRTDMIQQLGEGALFPDVHDHFQREPWTARFQAVGGNFSFVLANIHTRPASAVEEIGALDSVVLWARENWPDEDDFIVLGDFNASCSHANEEQLSALELSGNEYLWIVPNTADTNLSPSRCAYDRIVTTQGVIEDYAGIWDVDRAFFARSVSDHWPVWAAFYVGRDGTQ